MNAAAVRQALRIADRLRAAQLTYAQALSAHLVPNGTGHADTLPGLIGAAMVYVEEFSAAADHLRAHPDTLALLNLGVMQTADQIDAHLHGVCTSVVIWQDELAELVR